MAKRNQDGLIDPGTMGNAADYVMPTDGITAPLIPIEEQPQRGGSYTRNPDGTLQQIEGHGFADPELTKE